MIKIKLNKEKYNVPNSFDELSIGKFQLLNEVEKDTEKRMMIHYINILTGIDTEMIKRIEMVDIKKIMDNFNFFEINKEDHDIIEAVKIDKIYKFDRDLFNMRFDMFIDLEELTKDKEQIIKNLHLIMAILYRPVIKKKLWSKKLVIEEYDSESVKDRGDYFKENLMMDKVIGALFFFIQLKLKYIKDLEGYLIQMNKEMTMEMNLN